MQEGTEDKERDPEENGGPLYTYKIWSLFV